ncbi:MAG: tyrosine-type recombinase/integrase [Acetobacteraceae bacterium]|nr:tyrosine-type recombinase/integrase [Acetobacteraceae bacterium]
MVYVPPSLHGQLGKKLRLSLKTRDLRVAQARRWAAVAALKRRIEEARRGPRQDARTLEALAYRDGLSRVAHGGHVVHFVGGLPPDLPDDPKEAQAEFLLEQAAERAQEIEEELARSLGEARAAKVASDWFDLATGRATPLDHHVDTWLAEGGKRGPVGPATQRAYRRAVSDLSAWCAQEGHAATLEGITGRVAGAFATHLARTKKERGTANNTLYALSAYWRWLMQKHFVAANPWAGQTLGEGPSRDSAEERPFTDAEMVKLLTGGADAVLLAGMRVAALSGLRVEEMHQLRIRDCQDGAFSVTRSKTPAGIRKVPIHSDLVSTVAWLSKGKRDDDYLFPSNAKGWRSDAMTNRFRTLQKKVGVLDRSAGRRSLVNFHSFRRWFISKAEQAGIPLDTVALVVGHRRNNVTFGVYSRDPAALWANKVACVEAVKLPPL